MMRIVVLCGLCLLETFSAGAVATLRVPGSITVGPGEAFSVPVHAENLSGLLGYYVVLDYSSYIDFVELRAGALASDWSTPLANPLSSHCAVAAYGADALYGSGTLFTLQLRVKQDAPNGNIVPLHFSSTEFNDGALTVNTQDGQIHIARTVLMTMPARLRKAPGEELLLPIKLDEAGGVLGYYFIIRYNHALLDFIAVEADSGPAEWGDAVVNHFHNEIMLAGMGSNALSGPETLAELRFQVRSDIPVGMETPITFQQAELNDGAISVVTQECMVDIYDPNDLPLGGLAVLATMIIGLGILVPHCRRRQAGARKK